MGCPDELPKVLQPLVRHNAVSISDRRWDTDVTRLAQIVALDIPSATESTLHWLNLGISGALFSTILNYHGNRVLERGWSHSARGIAHPCAVRTNFSGYCPKRHAAVCLCAPD
jgi:hypothetical protein